MRPGLWNQSLKIVAEVDVRRERSTLYPKTNFSLSSLTMSENFERFQQDFLDASTWNQRKDGVPFDLLDNLAEDERYAAEELLIDALSAGDDWPARGLGHMRSTKALPSLYALLPHCQQGVTISVAYAIFQINRDLNMIEVVLEEFPKITNEYSLIGALHLLPIFPDQRITSLLTTYTHDRRYLVVYNATRALGGPTNAVVEEFRGRKIGKNWWQRLFSGQ